MLLGKNRGRHKENNLFSLLHGLKRCPDCNLCLAVADITTDQAIHDTTALHVFLGCFDGG